MGEVIGKYHLNMYCICSNGIRGLYMDVPKVKKKVKDKRIQEIMWKIGRRQGLHWRHTQ